ncbi:MAG: ribosomal L7Ae/L30e/S12e/Gadd45 family protein [Coprococcus sp.]|nr:ribosomal L7Ae/L30e/S12e/Gadd45 family protein [Coprococcus sp.]
MKLKNDKVYSLISLCARARRLTSGNFSVERAVKSRSAYVVIVATDASANTKKLFDQKCNYYKIPYYEYGNKEELGRYTGNEMRTSVAVLDEGFANQIIKCMNVNENMEV